ncbi:MAG: HAD-IA family hydrolase [Elusimicrobiota bacterium]|jgi:phosphoglycolate phosphatase|nr:HAD-IA family hydrolase [Elusimicrobiota bacterium]
MDLKTFELLIFDLDGTLVDSQKDLANAVNFVRKNYGFEEIATATVRSYLGDGISSLLEKSLPVKNVKLLKEAIEKFKSFYAIHLTDTTILYNCVKETLEVLNRQRGKTLVLLSNKSQKFCFEILKRLGILDFFKEVWGGDTLAKKPDPKPILELAKITNSALESTIIIGDSPNDFLAAKNAKISFVAAEYGYCSLEQIKTFNPDFSIKSINQLLEILV